MLLSLLTGDPLTTRSEWALRSAQSWSEELRETLASF